MTDGAARILYIEDNPQNMRLVRKILVHHGYTVLEAIDGGSGLQTAYIERPDLILVDINLPDIDGLEVTTQLKQHPELRQTPVIALTANAMIGDRERTLAAGCDDYLPKPVSKQDLLDTVAKYLQRGDSE
ncbi:MAG: response regulator [Anaerolineae bacterium]|jgi:CheY-like chemotaxis protein|nr:response regulator [Anaerolineae bacterium]